MFYITLLDLYGFCFVCKRNKDFYIPFCRCLVYLKNTWFLNLYWVLGEIISCLCFALLLLLLLFINYFYGKG